MKLFRLLLSVLLLFLPLLVSTFAPSFASHGRPRCNIAGANDDDDDKEDLDFVDILERDHSMAREWNCRCSDEIAKIMIQVALQSVLQELPSSVQSVERLVSDEDFKVLISLSKDDFMAWEQERFDPEDAFIEMLQDIDGVEDICVQSFARTPML